jgi:DNA-binding SARP family transcriptional activator
VSERVALRIELTGELGLRWNGGVVPGAGLRRPAWTALAYLASERHRPVRRDELAEILWGEDAPESWDTIVRGLVSKLRTAFSQVCTEEIITTAFGCYQLHLPAGAVIDVEEAAGDVSVAEAALVAGEPHRAAIAASRAAAVAARQFLPGAQGPWVERRQAELDELRLRALEALAQATSALGDHRVAVETAEAAVALAPFRESSHLRLITAHAAAGNRAEALKAYERCRRALVEEMGVPPSLTVEAAYLRLLEDEAPVAPPRLAPQGPLPAPLTTKGAPPFVGRQHERAQLEHAWKRARDGERQVVFVGGEPGIGKTRIVGELAQLAHGDGARVLYGRCDEELVVPYQPLGDVVRQTLTWMSPADLGTRLPGHVGELARLVPELALAPADVARPAPHDPELARARLAEALDALLVMLADGPLVLILDDLHWAGEAALGVLRRLLRSPIEAALLVLATYRDTEVAPDHPLARLLADTRRDPNVTRLALAGLGPAWRAGSTTSQSNPTTGSPASRPPSTLRATHSTPQRKSRSTGPSSTGARRGYGRAGGSRSS